MSFKENAPHLYDMIVIDKSLESTSHTVQWLPLREESKEDDRFTTEYFLMGTHNEAEDEDQTSVKDSIMVCSVNLPKLNKGVKFDPSEDRLRERMSKIKVHKSIDHPQDVSKARAMIGEPNIVASFTNSGDILLYNFLKLEQTITLKGHENYGFGLSWVPKLDGSSSNMLISGGVDSKISLWDINKAPNGEGNIEALNTLTTHTKDVIGIDILPSDPNIFASVSDDSTLALWDTRDLKAPNIHVKASYNGLNAVAFNLQDDNVFLTGGQENGEIWLWDRRKIIEMYPLSTFIGHTRAVTNIQFSPINKNLFCSGALIPDENDTAVALNNGVIIWDINKIGEEVGHNADEESTLSPCLVMTHDGHDLNVDDICWSPYDERTLTTVDGNKSINIFQISEELFKKPYHYEREFEDMQI